MTHPYWLIALYAAFLPAVASAQVRTGQTTPSSAEQDDEPLPTVQQQTPLDTNQAGRSAQSSVGRIGQRQTRDTTAIETGIKPMSRIDNRIQNRIQNRIRTRIDRNYDPQATATDPFAVAEDRTRTTGRPR